MEKFSIVVSVFNEQEVLESFYAETIRILSEQAGVSFEMIFVNDGSTDRSAEIISSLKPADRIELKSLEFTRNFGHESAMLAGIHHATGDAVICMDCDLQHPPQLIPMMLKEYEHSKKQDKAQKEAIFFIKQKMDAAKWFIEMIQQRQQTLLMTMKAIMAHQEAFFMSGDTTQLRPMILKDIAEKECVSIVYCPTDHMIADFFTKPLQKKKFVTFRDRVLGLSI